MRRSFFNNISVVGFLTLSISYPHQQMFLLPESPRVGLDRPLENDTQDDVIQVQVSPKQLPSLHNFADESIYAATTTELERLLTLHRKPSTIGAVLEGHVDSILSSYSSQLSTTSLVALRRHLQALSRDVHEALTHTETVLSLASALKAQRDDAVSILMDTRSKHGEAVAALRAAETRELHTRDEVTALRQAMKTKMIPDDLALAQGKGDKVALQPGARQHALQLARLSQYSFLPQPAGSQTPPTRRSGAAWEQQRRHKEW